MRLRGGPTRRSAGSVAAGVAASIVLLVAVPAASQEHPPPTVQADSWIAAPVPAQPHPSEGMLPPGEWTAEQEAFLHELIARTEAALPAFNDPETLEDLGFFNFGVTAPGGYDHWLNPSWVDDGHLLDPNFPEALVFRNTAEGYEVEAAMFMLDSEHSLDNLPDDLAWLPGWHTHDELCVDDEGRFVGLVDMNGECSIGHPSDTPPMMHVWIVDNECGHRFGGIGVGGLDCDVHHEDPPPGHEDPPPGHEDPPPGHDNEGDDHNMPPPAARPAQPVQRQPDLTG